MGARQGEPERGVARTQGCAGKEEWLRRGDRHSRAGRRREGAIVARRLPCPRAVKARVVAEARPQRDREAAGGHWLHGVARGGDGGRR